MPTHFGDYIGSRSYNINEINSPEMKGIRPHRDFAERNSDRGIVGEDRLMQHVELDVGAGLKCANLFCQLQFIIKSNITIIVRPSYRKSCLQ